MAIHVSRRIGRHGGSVTNRVSARRRASQRLAALVGVLMCVGLLLPVAAVNARNTMFAAVATTATAPTAVTVVGGDASAMVSWLAPSNASTSDITNYRIRRYDSAGDKVLGMTMVRGTRSSVFFPGLRNGRPYSFDVTAASGTTFGLVSNRSGVVTPPQAASEIPPTPGLTATVPPVIPTSSATVPSAEPRSSATDPSVIPTSSATVPSAEPRSSATVPSAEPRSSATVPSVEPRSSATVPSVASTSSIVPSLTLKLPSPPAIGTATPRNRSAVVRWRASSNGGAAITGYSLRVVNAATNRTIGGLRRASARATSMNVTGLVNGTAVRFQVRATNVVGTSAFSTLSRAVRPATVARAPGIRAAASGAAGGRVDAVARWAPPVSNGGSAVTGYVVIALKMNANGTVRGHSTSAVQRAGVRSLRMVLSAGSYRFAVKARTAVGISGASVRSNLVRAR